MCALRFLYGTTLGLKDAPEQIPLPRKEDTLSTVLSRDEVMRFLKAVTDLRMRTTACLEIVRGGDRRCDRMGADDQHQAPNHSPRPQLGGRTFPC